MANHQPITSGQLLTEIIFSTSRSGGPGGQNVNKVNSKVLLRWNIKNSFLIDDQQKELLLKKLAPYITTEGDLLLTSQESRSQTENKEIVIAKLNSLLKKAFSKPKARKATKPTKSSKVKRVDTKKRHAEKKQWRKKLE